MLLLLTDVGAVYLGLGIPEARQIKSVGAATLMADQFAAGSMRPKIEAATSFVVATGHTTTTGRLDDAGAIVRGDAGTKTEAGDSKIEILARP
jgi:carbamate kinase